MKSTTLLLLSLLLAIVGCDSPKPIHATIVITNSAGRKDTCNVIYYEPPIISYEVGDGGKYSLVDGLNGNKIAYDVVNFSIIKTDK